MTSYTDILQAQINADIQSIKSGLLDIDALRARIMSDEADPDNPYTEVILWLNALATGLIDHLEIEVKEGKNNTPVFNFYPEINKNSASKSDAVLLKLPVPGPSPSAPPISLEDDSDDLMLAD